MKTIGDYDDDYRDYDDCDYDYNDKDDDDNDQQSSSRMRDDNSWFLIICTYSGFKYNALITV
jgi:hypothetical protein